MKRLWLIIFLLYTGCDSIKKDQIGPYYGGISEREAAGTIFTNELWVCLEESNGNYFLDSSCGEGKNTYLLTKERKNVYYLIRGGKKEYLTITNSKNAYEFVYKNRKYQKKDWHHYRNRPEPTMRPAVYRR